MSSASEPPPDEPGRVGSSFSFRTRLTFGLVAAAVLPVVGFGVALAASQVTGGGLDDTVTRLLLFAIAMSFGIAWSGISTLRPLTTTSA